MFFFFQAEDGIRDLVRSRGLGDVYKRQVKTLVNEVLQTGSYSSEFNASDLPSGVYLYRLKTCLLYTSDAADDLLCVDLGGRRIIKKKTQETHRSNHTYYETSKHYDELP